MYVQCSISILIMAGIGMYHVPCACICLAKQPGIFTVSAARLYSNLDSIANKKLDTLEVHYFEQHRVYLAIQQHKDGAWPAQCRGIIHGTKVVLRE